MKTILVALLLTFAPVLAEAQPHVIVIMTDDLDVATTQEAVSMGLMPNLKARIIDPGVTFAQHIVTDPRCCPSRATFLTGQYPHNHHTVTASQFQESTAIPCWLPASYWSVLIGKYLNGYGADPSQPVSSLSNPNHRPPCWSRWAGMIDFSTFTTFDYQVHDSVNGSSVITDHRQFGPAPWNYNTDMQTLRLLAAVNEAHALGRRLFAVVNYVAPHFHLETRDQPWRIENVCYDAGGQPSPWHPSDNLFGHTLLPAARHLNTVTGHPEYRFTPSPSFNEPDMTDKPVWLQPRPSLGPIDIDCLVKQDWRRKESLRAVDDGIGLLFSTLDALGMTSSTYVLFTSDNGYFRGEHRLTEKALFYRESRTVPLFITGPTLTPRTVTHLTSNTDLAPTIAAWTGATPNVTVDGRTLMPVMTGTQTLWRNSLVLESQANDTPGLMNAFGLVTANPARLYIEYANGERELYELGTDPFEEHNLSGDPARASDLQTLSMALAGLTKCRGLTCLVGEIAVGQ